VIYLTQIVRIFYIFAITFMLACFGPSRAGSKVQTATSAVSPASPQTSPEEARWNQLNGQVAQLCAQGKYSDALPFAQESLKLAETAFGRDSLNVATSLNHLALILDEQGKYPEAGPLWQRALAIHEKVLGQDHPDVAISLNDLGVAYKEQGKYELAEAAYRRALAIRERAFGPNNTSVAISLNNLALLLKEQGEYAEAESLFNRALKIRESAFGPNHPDVADSLNDLAALYQDQGRDDEAEPLYNRALTIRENTPWLDQTEVAISLNNIAYLYASKGRFTEAETLFKRAETIMRSRLGPDHPQVATCLNNLAVLYEYQREYDKAEPLLRRALTIRERALGPAHPYVAISLANLAGLYMKQANYAAAEALYLRALSIDEEKLAPDHPDVFRALDNLAFLYWTWGRQQEAEAYFGRGQLVLQKLFQKQFTYMTEKERLRYLATRMNAFPGYFSFCFAYSEQHPELIGNMFDALLWEKGMVATSVRAMRAKIAASGNKQALRLLDEITEKRTQVARIMAQPPPNPEEARKQTEELEKEAEILERELANQSPTSFEQHAKPSWRSVRDSLKPREAAVEFVRFQLYDGQKWTNKTLYAALVLTPKSKIAPTFVLLGDAATLECGPVNSYRQLLEMPPTCFPCPAPGGQSSSAPTMPNFYDAFWKPLQLPLGKASRIYISTDGILNQVSLAIVPDDRGKLLIDKYDLRIVLSTRELLLQPLHTPEQTAVLIGDPLFTISEADQAAALQTISAQEPPNGRQSQQKGYRSTELKDLSWRQLPGTGVEVQQVGTLLARNRWHVESYTQARALEEVMKRVRGPRILHVATHGFFLSDEDAPQSCSTSTSPSTAPDSFGPSRSLKQDPMLRSGLVFTGANRLSSGEPIPGGMDDGILTAYEAMDLNLGGTELVVLSACDTGLGETKAEEGVFGLRRALQVAGARSILMAMWQVPDVNTEKLMQAFYTKLLNGEEKHTALREAQIELRNNIKRELGRDYPREWGAFVMVGR
jgi:CHAT domain-containing protein/tetratricopeptide (TPR) repeat protein